MNCPILTIITPTYNRGNLIKRCFDSLCAQTNKAFEWIVVDDGSADNTEEVIRSFVPTDFSITYIRKENGGKHTALNAAHLYIQGKYVLILDSDDFLTDNAVQLVLGCWQRYTTNSEVGVVTFLRGNTKREPLCIVPDYGVPVEILRYNRTIIHSSDCCEVIRTDLFLKYPFPVFEGERFVAECALWNRVAQTHKCVYINNVIYICEYLEGGLSDSGRAMRIRNPRGGMFTSELRMGSNNYLNQRIKYGLLYCCYGFFAGKKARDILKEAKYKLLTALCLVPGYIIYRYWKKKYS